MNQITSHSNLKVKLARALRQRKTRQETGLFLVEGIRPVGEAIEAGAQLESLFYSPDLLRSEFAMRLLEEQEHKGIPCFALTAEIFASLADKENPQGILAVGRQIQKRLDELNPQIFAWGVALVDPQDPGNLGTILRTVDAVGASGMLLLESGASQAGAVDLYHPAAVRASMGTLFWYPVVSADFQLFVQWARRWGYFIIGASAHGTQDDHRQRLTRRPAILLLGSERLGLTPEQTAACDLLVRLPMRGRATSLNLAVAAGVLLYQMLE
jgi:TrmH family RNA methyltransferase